MSGWRSRPEVLGWLLLALTVFVYANSFSGVLEGDSGPLVTEDPRVHQVTPANLALIFSRQYWYPSSESAVYRPLVTLSWLLNYAVLGHGSWAAGYHAVNLALHLVNVLLAWLLCRRVWSEPLPAFFTAAVFAVHPVNVEAVTNIAGRADLMAALGVLAGLLLYTKLDGATGSRRLALLAGVFTAALFGVFSKENAVVLPAAMLLYDAVIRRARPVVAGYLVVLPALAAMFAARAWVFAHSPLPEVPFVDNPLTGASFWAGRLTAAQVVWRYVRLLLWPHPLSWDYSYNQIPMATTAAGLSALAALAAALLLLGWLYRRHVPACFCGAFFFLALAPVSNLFLLIGTVMAERLLYLPSIGFAGAAVALVSALPRRAAVATLVLALALLGWRTQQRNAEWTDGARLWAGAVAAAPNSFKTHLAVVYGMSRTGFRLDNIDYAIEQAEIAVAIVAPLPPRRTSLNALTTLGGLHKIKGDLLPYETRQQSYQTALETLLRAVPLDRELNPSPARGYAPLYQNLAAVYRRLGRFPEAIDALRTLLRITPDKGDLHRQIADLQAASR